MRGTLALLVLAVAAGRVHAQPGKVERVEIVEAGIYRAETQSVEQALGTATGRRNILSDTKLAVSTTRIPAEIGVHFGMRYRVVGRPTGATVRLISITQYPGPGLKNPKTGILQNRGEHTLFATIGVLNYRGYVLEHDWEVVPGQWVFELWDGSRKLATQTFEVVRP